MATTRYSAEQALALVVILQRAQSSYWPHHLPRSFPSHIGPCYVPVYVLRTYSVHTPYIKLVPLRAPVCPDSHADPDCGLTEPTSEPLWPSLDVLSNLPRYGRTSVRSTKDFTALLCCQNKQKNKNHGHTRGHHEADHFWPHWALPCRCPASFCFLIPDCSLFTPSTISRSLLCNEREGGSGIISHPIPPQRDVVCTLARLGTFCTCRRVGRSPATGTTREKSCISCT